MKATLLSSNDEVGVDEKNEEEDDVDEEECRKQVKIWFLRAQIFSYILGIIVFNSIFCLTLFSSEEVEERAGIASLAFGMVVFGITGNTALLNPPQQQDPRKLEVIPFPSKLKIAGGVVGVVMFLSFFCFLPLMGPDVVAKRSDEVAFASFCTFLICGPIRNRKTS
jgi:hypothetical protein